MVAKVSPKKSTLRRISMTPYEVNRAIYIDFEGTETDPATFLGVLCEEKWQVFLIESLFHVAVVPTRFGSLLPSSLASVCRRLANQSREENRKIVAWSSREVEEIWHCSELTLAERVWWSDNVVNLLPPAKRWANKEGILIAPIPSSRGSGLNKWSLSSFRKATGYPEIARVFEPGKTALRIRHVRMQLNKRGSYTDLTAVAKAKWTKVLTHNYHDCAGLKHVAMTIFGSQKGQE